MTTPDSRAALERLVDAVKYGDTSELAAAMKAASAALADEPVLPDDLALRVQRLESMHETEKAAVLDLYQQIDKLQARLDWQYTKIGRLEDFTIKDLAAAAHAMANEMEAQP